MRRWAEKAERWPFAEAWCGWGRPFVHHATGRVVRGHRRVASHCDALRFSEKRDRYNGQHYYGLQQRGNRERSPSQAPLLARLLRIATNQTLLQNSKTFLTLRCDIFRFATAHTTILAGHDPPPLKIGDSVCEDFRGVSRWRLRASTACNFRCRR